MADKQEKRMAGEFEIIHALHIGDREIVLGENPAGVGDERYMCAFCQKGDLLASYTEIMVSGDYPEIVKLFGERVAEQAEKTRIELNSPKIQGIPNAPITAEVCEVIGHQHDLRGKVGCHQARGTAPGIPLSHQSTSAMHWRLWRIPQQPRLRLFLHGVVFWQNPAF